MFHLYCSRIAFHWFEILFMHFWLISLEFGSIWTSGFDAVIINLTCSINAVQMCMHSIFTSVTLGGKDNAIENLFISEKKGYFVVQPSFCLLFSFHIFFAPFSYAHCQRLAIVGVSFSFVAYLKFQTQETGPKNDDCLNVCLR